jgi:hypothetical protein
MFVTNNLFKRTLSNLRIRKGYPFFNKVLMSREEQQRDIVSDNNQSTNKTTHLERTSNLKRQKVKFNYYYYYYYYYYIIYKLVIFHYYFFFYFL